MRIVNVIVAAGLTLGVAAMARADGEKVDLTPRFKAGESMTFKHRVVRTETMMILNVPAKAEEKAEEKTEGKGEGKGEGEKDGARRGDKAMMKQSWSVEQTAVYELRVVAATETLTTLELELKSIDASADLPQGKMSWKNDQPEDDKDQRNTILQTYKPIVGGIVKMTLDANGAVTEVKGDPRIRLEVGGTMAPMVQLMVGPDLVRARWSPVVWIKDGREPVGVGQTWTNSESIPNRALGRFVYETRNTLKGVKDSMAEIDIAGDIRLEPLENGKAAAATLSEHSIAGSAVWDVKAGRMKSYTVTEKTHLDVSANGIPVVRDLDMTTTITRE